MQLVGTPPEGTRGEARQRRILILAGRLFDPRSLQLVRDQAITVDPDSGLITDVRPLGELDSEVVGDADPSVVDLRRATVLPGFVDVHVHCTLLFRLMCYMHLFFSARSPSAFSLCRWHGDTLRFSLVSRADTVRSIDKISNRCFPFLTRFSQNSGFEFRIGTEMHPCPSVRSILTPLLGNFLGRPADKRAARRANGPSGRTCARNSTCRVYNGQVSKQSQ